LRGAASLLELLDAQRTYIGTNLEYLNDLASYWIAVFRLERAVGVDLTGAGTWRRRGCRFLRSRNVVDAGGGEL
jgi:hypothetical protein